MSEDAMELDESLVSRKAKSLETLIGGSFPSSLWKFSSSSRAIPANKDFHFYYNFDEFKLPTDEISANSQSVLETVSDSPQVLGKPMRLSGDIDGDDAYEWLVNVNDEIYERFDISMDEFERIRKKEEEIGRPLGPVTDENGFQMVYGRKKKCVSNGGDVKMAERDKKVLGSGKTKVPFHIPTIKKPQEEYNIFVDNTNQRFEHVLLEKSEDGQRFIHPLEKHSVTDFVDTSSGETEPVKSLPMRETPFKLVQDVKDLKDLAAKLRSVDEFAVDLEHNQYRSFQGLTCLMQISTRTEDYIVDTFKLWAHVGPYLREIFKDPKKRKVMHGADRDIIWLQRDFGIYICNLFDTGQASRVLKLERNSLEFLLQHFCGVTANKEYQNADWRIRPLPVEMIRYAREDTHYLLYIYDVMRGKLQTLPQEDERSDSPLIEVYKRSYDVCMQLYEKELLTENSCLHIYGIQGAGFNAVQLAIVAGLCQWRDAIARAEDESTGYVMPNKTLLDIAKEMPATTSKLRRLLKSRHPYIEQNIISVVSVIRKSMQNASAFEAAAQSLKEGGLGNVSYNKNIEPIDDGIDVSPRAKDVACQNSEERSLQGESSTKDLNTVSVNTNERKGLAAGLFGSAKVSAAVQISKKPSSGFGALLGNAASKRKFGSDDKPKEEIKLERIRSSVSLPFHSFLGKTSEKVSEKPEEAPSTGSAPVSKPDDVMVLKEDSDEEPSEHAETPSTATVTQNSQASGSKSEDVVVPMDGNSDKPLSVSELSSNFQVDGSKEKKKEKASGLMSMKPEFMNIKPFDYEAARNEFKPVGERAKNSKGAVSGGKKKEKVEAKTEFGQGKRRQAFPASGNRSMTFSS